MRIGADRGLKCNVRPSYHAYKPNSSFEEAKKQRDVLEKNLYPGRPAKEPPCRESGSICSPTRTLTTRSIDERDESVMARCDEKKEDNLRRVTAAALLSDPNHSAAHTQCRSIRRQRHCRRIWSSDRTESPAE